MALAKTEGPATKIIFLGIEIDTVCMTLSLPQVKLVCLRSMIRQWSEKHSCTKREQLSLIGCLQHAYCVVRPGRSSSAYDRPVDGVRALHHRMRLNAEFHSDLKWWGCFLPMRNGSGLLCSVIKREPQVVLTSDASGLWGCGAFTSTGQWFQLAIPDSWQEVHITVKELLPFVLVAAIWGPLWRGFTVSCRCDTAAIVAIINSGRSRMDRAMHLMRCLSFFLAHWDMMFVCSHIPGTDNCAADPLSRNSLSSFQSLVPEAEADPTLIHEDLLKCLVHDTPDWTKVDWVALFRNTS